MTLPQSSRVFKHLSFLRFDAPFTVEQGENGLQIAPKSYRRYDPLAQAINAINTRSAVTLYKTFRPLMLQVFAEFSYPKDISLESIVKKAGSEILAAPVIDGQVAVVRPSMFYKFADPSLEALNPVQKQIIRMGPYNAKIIQNKCREFLVELGKAGLQLPSSSSNHIRLQLTRPFFDFTKSLRQGNQVCQGDLGILIMICGIWFKTFQIDFVRSPQPSPCLTSGKQCVSHW